MGFIVYDGGWYMIGWDIVFYLVDIGVVCIVVVDSFLYVEVGRRVLFSVFLFFWEFIKCWIGIWGYRGRNVEAGWVIKCGS